MFTLHLIHHERLHINCIGFLAINVRPLHEPSSQRQLFFFPNYIIYRLNNPHAYKIVCIEASHPSQQFFSNVGTEPTLPGFNQYCRELMHLAQGHNMVTPVGIEPRTSRFRVQSSTTTPLCSHAYKISNYIVQIF